MRNISKSHCWANIWLTLCSDTLQDFLSQRLTEMKEEADILSINQFQTAPAIVQSQDEAKVVTMMSVVRDLVQRLTNVKMRHLFMIHASPRYIDRVTELLQQKLRQAEAVGEKQHLMVQKRQQSLEEQAALEPKLDLLVQRTKELRKLASYLFWCMCGLKV
ncbi:hypothetical protein scyTo_0024702 [Scyliorhinus torazame]|uniref:Uncharacterized protein n=1 Tax=Scyliorhinus torazame TaxID=75743 RepID=A0A401QFN1_SCYTO|nr:hypothetical protein [Scyliorhinus torazame]